MLLLDIGNTNVKYFDGTRVWRERIEAFHAPEVPFYYINVNPQMESLLEPISHAEDLKTWFDFPTHYTGLGIDRIAACYTVGEGVVIDAGSAITVDVMQDGKHKGGFIMPGLSSTKESFANISSKLICDPDRTVDLTRLPQNTADALTYATIKPVILMIEDVREALPIIVTGGDAKRLLPWLNGATLRENLVFEGMQRVIKEKRNAC